nr:sulfurtransferase complex subunit TusB [Candidatus Njordarchaeota archaeon]
MSILFILTKTQFTTTDVTRVIGIATDLRKLNEDVGILLTQDSVLTTIQGQRSRFDEQLTKALEAGVKFYVLEPDAKARGLKKERAVQGVEFVDYSQWVDIVVEKYQRIANWT